MFVNESKNSAGVIQVRYFIRSKPWVFNIDSSFLFKEAFNNELNLHNALKFALINTYEVDNTVMWAPLLEKAWAKIKGNYEISNGGYIPAGIKSLTNAPVAGFSIADIGEENKPTLDEVWQSLYDADQANYIMGAGTAAGSDTTSNSCGIAYGHAYSILSAFTMTMADGVTTEKFVMIRNPWGSTGFNNAEWRSMGDWDENTDTAPTMGTSWTDALIAQLPFGFDPSID